MTRRGVKGHLEIHPPICGGQFVQDVQERWANVMSFIAVVIFWGDGQVVVRCYQWESRRERRAFIRGLDGCIMSLSSSVFFPGGRPAAQAKTENRRKGSHIFSGLEYQDAHIPQRSSYANSGLVRHSLFSMWDEYIFVSAPSVTCWWTLCYSTFIQMNDILKQS